MGRGFPMGGKPNEQGFYMNKILINHILKILINYVLFIWKP